MFKLWIKTYLDEKLTRNILYENEGDFLPYALFEYMSEVCGGLDIPTPVILSTHKKRLDEFNITRFKRQDFVEAVDFDMLTAEYVIAAKKDPHRF